MDMEHQKRENGAEEVEIVVREELRQKKDIILPISILIAAVMITGAVVFLALYKGGSGAGSNNDVLGTGNNSAPAAALTPSSASTTAILALGPRDAILGNQNAPVTVIEYGDYQCPFCSQYFENVEPKIAQQYINTGKVKMVFRNFAFLGPESIAAAEAAECAQDQGKLWPYHDALYTAKSADFAKGGSEDDGLFTRALFIKIAQQLGMDVPTFTSCIDSNKYASLVAQEKADAAMVGVNSTPATLINGVLVTDSTGQSVGANGPAVLAAIASSTAGE